VGQRREDTIMNHLHMNVPNVAEAQSFFEKYFDFRQVYPGSQRLFLMGPGDFLLAIDPLEPGEKPNFPEWFHFGMCRSDPEWARSLYARMKADGVEFFRKLEECDVAAVFFCCAPGGYKVEVRGNKS
jgi:catechol 2,3-dioxygenase-like lactoylglutathione lyase family enzyme